MTRTRIALGLLVVLLAACGEPRVAPQIAAAPAADPVSILVLDPAGRLLGDDNLSLLLVTADGTSEISAWPDQFVFRLRELPPPDAQLLVFAQGCRPKLADLVPGRNIVRLEVGIRVRLTLVGERPNAPKHGSIGLSLSRRVEELEGVRLRSDIEVHSVAASTVDEDLARYLKQVPIPASGVVDVLFSVTGAYELRWQVKVEGHSTSIGTQETLLVDSAAIAMDIEWGTRDINAETKRIEGGR